MTILNIAGYRFIELTDLPKLQQDFRAICTAQQLKGTVLLSPEGINVSLAGTTTHITAFKDILATDLRFKDMRFHETWSETIPFQKLKIKIKKEIITFKQTSANPMQRAPSISPAALKEWLDQQKDITLLDTRNEYEIAFGTFQRAINPHIDHFTELADYAKTLDREKPLVMFCTGGIRCEKAACYMQDMGFKQVYQLDGGILGYFHEVGGAHWQGSCFVFDERIALTPDLSAVNQIEPTQISL